jgi:hypothetical protein
LPAEYFSLDIHPAINYYRPIGRYEINVRAEVNKSKDNLSGALLFNAITAHNFQLFVLLYILRKM